MVVGISGTLLPDPGYLDFTAVTTSVRIQGAEGLEPGPAPGDQSFVGIWGRPAQGFAWIDVDPIDDPEPDPGPYLCPRGEAAHYHLMRRPALPSRFLQLASHAGVRDQLARPALKAAIKTFADDFGTLGANLREVFPPGVPVRAESLATWVAELRAYADLAELYHRAERAQASGADRDRRALTELIRWDHDELVVPALDTRFQLPRSRSKEPVAETAIDLVAWEVGRRLHGHLRLVVRAGRGVSHVPDSLLAAVYVRFALDVAGMAGDRSRTRYCAECGALFKATRSDARFCKPACRAAHARRNRREAG